MEYERPVFPQQHALDRMLICETSLILSISLLKKKNRNIYNRYLVKIIIKHTLPNLLFDANAYFYTYLHTKLTHSLNAAADLIFFEGVNSMHFFSREPDQIDWGWPSHLKGGRRVKTQKLRGFNVKFSPKTKNMPKNMFCTGSYSIFAQLWKPFVYLLILLSMGSPPSPSPPQQIVGLVQHSRNSFFTILN